MAQQIKVPVTKSDHLSSTSKVKRELTLSSCPLHCTFMVPVFAITNHPPMMSLVCRLFYSLLPVRYIPVIGNTVPKAMCVCNFKEQLGVPG